MIDTINTKWCNSKSHPIPNVHLTAKICVCVYRTWSTNRNQTSHYVVTYQTETKQKRRGMRTNSGLLSLWKRKIHFHPSLKILYKHPFEKLKQTQIDVFFQPNQYLGHPSITLARSEKFGISAPGVDNVNDLALTQYIQILKTSYLFFQSFSLTQ